MIRGSRTQYIEAGGYAPKKRSQLHLGYGVFWNSKGILLTHYLRKVVYRAYTPSRQDKKIRETRTVLKYKEIILHKSNALTFVGMCFSNGMI